MCSGPVPSRALGGPPWRPRIPLMTHPTALGVEMRRGMEGNKEAVAGVDTEEAMKDGMEEAGGC